MLSSKMLDESSFLKFISRVNEDFIRKDEEEYEALVAAGKGFDLNVKKWISKCKENTLRDDNGAMVSFKTFALDRINALLNVDIDLSLKSFREGNLKDKDTFLVQLGEFMQQVSKKEYLKPVTPELMLRLTKIREEVEGLGGSKTSESAKDGSDYLVWNGSMEKLGSIFCELNGAAKSTLAGAFLNYSSAQLSEFISRHFRKADGSLISADEMEKCLNCR